MAGKYLLTIQQFRRRVSRLSNGSGSVVAQIPSTIVETTDGGTTYAGVYVQGWQTSLRVFHQTLNDRVRPLSVIPGFQLYFRFAATTDVPVMQFVLPSSASSRHSAANDER